MYVCMTSRNSITSPPDVAIHNAKVGSIGTDVSDVMTNVDVRMCECESYVSVCEFVVARKEHSHFLLLLCRKRTALQQFNFKGVRTCFRNVLAPVAFVCSHQLYSLAFCKVFRGIDKKYICSLVYRPGILWYTINNAQCIVITLIYVEQSAWGITLSCFDRRWSHVIHTDDRGVTWSDCCSVGVCILAWNVRH